MYYTKKSYKIKFQESQFIKKKKKIFKKKRKTKKKMYQNIL